ncbi:MAG: hypothetical protein OXK16_14475 [bacterium]|nr:hypothetical protein [bacterium]MDE0377150.1 hypothetical protein [bacterium]
MTDDNRQADLAWAVHKIEARLDSPSRWMAGLDLVSFTAVAVRP